jgi:hypothetical protein
MLAGAVFQVLYPLVNEPNGPGWRMFFWLGAWSGLIVVVHLIKGANGGSQGSEIGGRTIHHNHI